MGRPYILRDFRGVAVRFYPFQHDPVAGTLWAQKLLRIKVYENGAGSVNIKTHPRYGKADPSFIGTYQNHFMNYPGGGGRNELPPEAGQMLIIAADGYNQNSALLGFEEWKKRRGFNTHLSYCQDLANFSGDALIEFIDQQYNSIDNLSFVVLVGDGAEAWAPHCVPFPWDDLYEQSPATLSPADNRCVDLEGDDKYPDLYISRVAAGDPEALGRQLNRVVDYERYPPVEGTGPVDWYQVGTGIASWEGDAPYWFYWNPYKDYEWTDMFRNELIAGGFSDVDRIYWENVENPCPVNPQWVADHLNQGRSWVNYIGHGFQTQWVFREHEGQHWPSVNVFHANDIWRLNNGVLPFVWSTSCYAGRFYDSENDSICLANAWMGAGSENDPSGSVGFFGAACPMKRAPAIYAHQEGVSLVADPASMVHSTGGICFNGIYEMLDVFADTLEEGMPTYYSRLLQGAECWTVFGDCSMQIRTRPPETMTVGHPTHVGRYKVEGSSISVPIDVEGGVLVDEMVTVSLLCQYTNEESLLSQVLTGTGQCVFDVPVTYGDGTLIVTVSGFNKYPYESEILLLESYYGMQSGEQEVVGGFLVPSDITAGVSLVLDAYAGGTATFYFADEPQSGMNPGGRDPNEVEVIVDSNHHFQTHHCAFELDDEFGEWGGFYLNGLGAQMEISDGTVGDAEIGIYAYIGGSYITLGNNCCVENCEFGLRAEEGSHLSISESTFRDNEYYGILAYSSIFGQCISDCTFENNGIGIQVHDSNVDVHNSTFTGTTSALTKGIDLRDNSSGSVMQCEFISSGALYHGVVCRAGNDLVSIVDNLFDGPGFVCGPLSTNSCGVFAFGGIGTNRPTIRENDIHGFWFGASVWQALPDLGTADDYGHNDFQDNCCDVRFSGMTPHAPSSLEAVGNCWEMDPVPGDDALCGNWADSISWSPGHCEGQDGAPPFIPSTVALRIVGPNPFSEEVVIRIEFPGELLDSKIKLEISDVGGRLVKRFNLKSIAPGSTNILWDGRGIDGAELPSGIYVCRVAREDRILSRKVVFLRDTK